MLVYVWFQALDALGRVALKCRVHTQIIDEDERLTHVISGAWPTAIPYAVTILPTPSKWYDKGRPTSSGCLNEDSPNVMRLGFAAASPKLRRAASLATGALSAVVGAATLEKVGGAIGVYMGGAPGAAAGTLAGRSLDGLHTTSGNTNGDENVPQEGQFTEARVIRLIETGRITAAEMRGLMEQTPARLVSDALDKGMSVDEIETLVKLAFPEKK